MSIEDLNLRAVLSISKYVVDYFTVEYLQLFYIAVKKKSNTLK